jgi:peptidoglycan hydrolase-like protein with peptidoglycan-binding domain
VTLQALQRFQEAHQISGDGALTAETLLVLVEQRCRNGCDLRVSVAATAEASALPGTPPFTDQAAPINTALSGPDLPILMSHLLQEVLTQQGYAIPEAQECLGPPLQAALRRFQSDHGLAAHGQLTQETILVLLATACGAGCEFRLTVGARQEDKSAGPVSIDGPQIRKIIPGQTLPQGPVQVADKAYAIEYVECSAVSGAWVRLYEGTVVRQDDRTVALRLEERFSYRYHPDSEGVDRTDWWCIPPKRHCYVPIDFHDWNGTFAKRTIASFPADRVVHARLGIIQSVLPFVHKQCNQ